MKMFDPNKYTEAYVERDKHFLCDDQMSPQSSKAKKQEKKNDGDVDDGYYFDDNIAGYSTIF